MSAQIDITWVREKWERNYWDDRHQACHKAIGVLLAALEHAERALASCKAHAEEIRTVAKQQRHRADEAEATIARLRHLDIMLPNPDDGYLHTTLHGVKVKVLLDE